MENQITVALLKQVRETLTSALESQGKALGIKITLGSCTYGQTDATFKLAIQLPSTEGRFVPKEEVDFFKKAELFGLKPGHFGAEFTTRDGKTFKVSGLKTRNRKYPFIASCNGRNYKFPAKVIREKLGIKSDGTMLD